MGFLETLDDFAACIAIAVNIAPEGYPGWTGGWKAHIAEMMVLWAEIRPQLQRDVEHIQRVEAALQKMSSAAEVGDTDSFQEAARTLHGLSVSKLR